jgi:hypothetical protein
VARAVLTPRVLDEEKAAVAGMGGAEDWQNVWQKGDHLTLLSLLLGF